MATTGAQLDQGGPGLLFIFLPHLIRSMPGGWLIAILFFTAVFLAGMTSLMNLYEAPVATVQEKTGLGRKASCAIDVYKRQTKGTPDVQECPVNL